MPPESVARPSLGIVVFSGAFDRVHYALVMASAAAAIGRPTMLFFTMEACRALLAPEADGTPAWRRLPAGDRAGSAGTMDDDFKQRGIGDFEQLLSACQEMGVRFLVCEMGLRASGLSRADLRADIAIEEGGVVTFLNEVPAGGNVLFV
jgi:peroxiredoxin family protein